MDKWNMFWFGYANGKKQKMLYALKRLIWLLGIIGIVRYVIGFVYEVFICSNKMSFVLVLPLICSVIIVLLLSSFD